MPGERSEVKTKILLTVIFLFLAMPSFAWDISELEWDKKGELITRIYQDVVDDNELEDKIVTDLMFEMNNSIWLIGDYLRIKADFEARAETFVGYGSEAKINVNFTETFLELTSGAHKFTLGEKIVTWGKLDDAVILDRVNPQDLTRFVMFDKQERKEAVLMFKHDFRGDNWQIESVLEPYFEPSDVDFFNSDWSVFGQLKNSVKDGTLSAARKTAVRSISIEDDDSVTDKNLKNGQVGLKFSSKVSDIDYSLYYMNMYNSLPVLRERTATGNLVKQYLYAPTLANLDALIAASPSGDDYVLDQAHARQNIIGADWEAVVGSYGARGEIGILLDQPYLRNNFSYVEKDVISLGIGIDHTTAQNIYFNMQYLIDHILDYESLFAQEETVNKLTGSLSKDFMRGIILVNLDWFYSLSYTDWMINPSIDYNFDNGLNLSLGGFIFDGSATTVFGRFDTKDLIYTELKYSF